MCFSISHAAAHQRARTGGVIGIERIHVKSYGVSGAASRCNRNRFVHACAHATLVDLTHSEESNTQFADQLPLAGVDVSSPDVRAELRFKLRSKPADVGKLFGAVTQ